MNEKEINKLMTVAGATLACVAGLACVTLILFTAVDGLLLLLPAILLGLIAVGGGWTATYYGSKIEGHNKVFDNSVENEVLTPQQRKVLKKARGEVVMERAMIDIEHERQNIVHKQLEASHDPDKPPHQTSFNAGAPTNNKRRQLEEPMLVKRYDEETDIHFENRKRRAQY